MLEKYNDHTHTPTHPRITPGGKRPRIIIKFIFQKRNLLYAKITRNRLHSVNANYCLLGEWDKVLWIMSRHCECIAKLSNFQSIPIYLCLFWFHSFVSTIKSGRIYYWTNLHIPHFIFYLTITFYRLSNREQIYEEGNCEKNVQKYAFSQEDFMQMKRKPENQKKIIGDESRLGNGQRNRL